MVKKEQGRERRFGTAYGRCILREIKGSFGRFIAIIGIVALGVGFLLGILSTTPDLKASMSQYYTEKNLCDAFIKSTLGLTEEDAQALLALPEVEGLVKAYSQDVMLETPLEENMAVRVIGSDLEQNASSEGINQLTLVEGRMPESSNECLVLQALGNRVDFPIGTELSVVENGDGLAVDQLTVVGIVTDPFYISVEKESSTIGSGKVDAILYTGEESFSLDVYTDFYLTIAGANEFEYFSDDYEEYIDEQLQVIQPVADERAGTRYQSVYNEAAEELESAKTELENGRAQAEKELAQAEQQLADTKTTLEQSESDLQEAKVQLEATWTQLQNGRSELDAGWAELEAMQSTYESGVTEYNDAKSRYDSGKAAYDAAYETYQESVIQYRVGESNLQTAREQLEQLKQIYAALQEELTNWDQIDIEQLRARLEELKELLPEGSSAFLDELIAYLSQGDVTESQIVKLYEQIENGIAQLEEQIASGEKELAEAKTQLDAGKAQLDATQEQLTDANRQLIEAEVKLELAQEQLSGGRTTLEQQETAYEEGLAAYRQGVTEYEQGLQSVEQGWTEYEKGVTQLEEERANTEKELEEAERQIRSSQSQLDELESRWYLLDLGSNVGYASYKINVEKVADIAKIFPVFFFLIAALVTLTTMTRMVEEERTQIGTLKALGYSKGKILSKYMIYCGLATVLGCLIGLGVGFWLLPSLIQSAYATMFQLPPLLLRFDVFYAVISCGAEFLCTLGATMGACLYSLKEKPAYLMLPRVPKAGQRIFLEKWNWLWKRLSFSYKATARNIFRYKKHLFMTIIGISGCTALMLAAFGLNDSMNQMVDKQYGEVLRYDLQITTDGTQDDTLQTFLQDRSYMEVMSSSVSIVGEDDTLSATLMTTENEDTLSDFIHLYNRKEKEELSFSGRSLIITEKLANELGVSVGDTITLEKNNGRSLEGEVTGITENYVGIYVYMGSELYQEAFGTVSPNLLLVQSGIGEEQQTQVISDLLNCESVSSSEFTTQSRSSYDNLLTSLTFIVVVISVAACALAVIVLYNLTNINISERLKELATLRVLGYHYREVGAYIFREINILSFLGALVGTGLGVWLHYYIVVTAESPELMFGREISWVSFVMAIAITLILSLLVDALMWVKIKRIRMTDSMKAVD